MIRLRGVGVVVLLVASSLLTLKLMGLSQWVQAILVIAVELCLGVLLHSIAERRETRRDPPSHRVRSRPSHRRKSAAEPKDKHRGAGVDVDGPAYHAETRLMLPIRGDRPAMVEHAIRECRCHRSELDLLFVRVIAALPMSPSFEPSEVDDEEARAVIERARGLADRAGVPFRSSYVVTHRAAATILERAVARRADFLLMAAPGRRGLVKRLLTPDDSGAVLKALPDHIGLLIHA